MAILTNTMNKFTSITRKQIDASRALISLLQKVEVFRDHYIDVTQYVETNVDRYDIDAIFVDERPRYGKETWAWFSL